MLTKAKIAILTVVAAYTSCNPASPKVNIIDLHSLNEVISLDSSVTSLPDSLGGGAAIGSITLRITLDDEGFSNRYEVLYLYVFTNPCLPADYYGVGAQSTEEAEKKGFVRNPEVLETYHPWLRGFFRRTKFRIKFKAEDIAAEQDSLGTIGVVFVLNSERDSKWKEIISGVLSLTAPMMAVPADLGGDALSGILGIQLSFDHMGKPSCWHLEYVDAHEANSNTIIRFDVHDPVSMNQVKLHAIRNWLEGCIPKMSFALAKGHQWHEVAGMSFPVFLELNGRAKLGSPRIFP